MGELCLSCTNQENSFSICTKLSHLNSAKIKECGFFEVHRYIVSRFTFPKISRNVAILFVILIFRFILVGKGLLFIYASNLIILAVDVNMMFTFFSSVTASYYL